MLNPAIRTTVVGSYPVPDWLSAFPSETALVDATRVVLSTQELAGIDVVADGELYRFDVNHPDTNGMIDYFVRPMSGIDAMVSRAEAEEFADIQGMGFRARPAAVVRETVGEGTLDLPADYRRARTLTRAPFKFTVTGPHMLSKTLLDRHYSGKPELAMALADVLARQVASIDADVIQLDEANIPGHPEEKEWAAEALNRVLDAADAAKEKGVHVCFGNYGGQSIQQGLWTNLLPYLNALHCDHLVLEFAFRGYDELAHLRDGLDSRIALGLGVIDIKTNIVESPSEVARRIETGVRIMGEGRVRWVHPDCGFWMLKRSVADRKITNLVRGARQFLGTE
jgi:5-methyltetrahydropteroyltriglutamate--homocysteine methyltransferase